MFSIIINGTKHKVTLDRKTGVKVYDPPLPTEEIAKRKNNFQEMVETGQLPTMNCDVDSFHKGRGTLLDQLDGDEVWAKHVTSNAKKHGYTPGNNDVYLGQLARFPGDPDAFFKPGEGKAELKKRVEESGKGVHMPGLDIEAKPKEIKSKKLADKHVRDLAKGYRASGEADGMSDADLKKTIIKKHGRKTK